MLSRCTVRSPDCLPQGRRVWRWKSLRSAWSRGASTASLSGPLCSPISRAITSTITATWRTMRARSSACSKCPISSTPCSIWTTCRECGLPERSPDAARTARATVVSRESPPGQDSRAMPRRTRSKYRRRGSHSTSRVPGARRASKAPCLGASTCPTCWESSRRCSFPEWPSSAPQRRSQTCNRSQDACSAWAEGASLSWWWTTPTHPTRSKKPWLR